MPPNPKLMNRLGLAEWEDLTRCDFSAYCGGTQIPLLLQTQLPPSPATPHVLRPITSMLQQAPGS